MRSDARTLHGSVPVRPARRPIRWERYWFLFPGLGVLILINIFPMLYSLWVSFHRFVLGEHARPFIGLRNFANAITNADFIHALWMTGLLTVATVGAQLVFGLIIALVLNRDDIFGRRIFSTIFILPMAVSPLVVGILWRFMLNPSYGVLTYVVDKITGQHVDLLTHPVLATIALLVTYTWAWMPFATLFLYSALLGTDPEPLEAAQVDGASNFRIIWSIQLPMIRQLIVLVMLLQTITAFRMFTVPDLLTAGGPGTTTQTLSYLVWLRGLNYFDLGSASAMSWLMVIVASVFAMLFLRFGRFEV